MAAKLQYELLFLLCTSVSALFSSFITAHDPTPTPPPSMKNPDCVHEQNPTCTCSLKTQASGACARFDSDIDVHKSTTWCVKDSWKCGECICDCSGDMSCEMKLQRTYVLDEIPGRRRLLQNAARCHIEGRVKRKIRTLCRIWRVSKLNFG